MENVKAKDYLGQILDTHPSVGSARVQTLLENSGRLPARTIRDLLLQMHPLIQIPMDAVDAVIDKVAGGRKFHELYNHDDPEVKEFVIMNFEQMDGSLFKTFQELRSARPFGWAFAEWSLRKPKREDRGTLPEHLLKSINLVPHTEHYFEGKDGEITAAVYQPQQGEEVRIPYAKGIHVVHKPDKAAALDMRAYGIPQLQYVAALVDVCKVVLNLLPTAAQVAAKGILVAESDRSLEGFDSASGQRSSALEDLTNAVASLGTEDNTVVGVLKELQDVRSLGIPIDTSTFMSVLEQMMDLIFMSLGISKTLLTTGGSSGTGDSNLAAAHRDILDDSITSLIDDIKQGIIEQVVRPLIILKFGEREDGYGHFKDPEFTEAEILSMAESVMSAIDRGIYSVSDAAIVNRLRELHKLPQLEESADGKLVASMSVDY